MCNSFTKVPRINEKGLAPGKNTHGSQLIFDKSVTLLQFFK